MALRSWRVVVAALTLIVGGLVAAPAQADPPETDACPVGYSTDFNGDGFADVVVGDPPAAVAGHAAAGRLVVLYGDAGGRVGEGDRRTVLRQGSAAIGGKPETGDQFGYSLSVADIDCDGFTDVVVGSPYEDLGSAADAGYVQIVWGASAGLGTGAAARGISRASFYETVRAGDQFGFAVDTQEDWIDGATGALNAYVLAIGAPGADVHGHADAGWVGVRSAVDGGNTLFSITQDTSAIPGTAETGDRFDAAVTVGSSEGPRARSTSQSAARTRTSAR